MNHDVMNNNQTCESHWRSCYDHVNLLEKNSGKDIAIANGIINLMCTATS